MSSTGWPSILDRLQRRVLASEYRNQRRSGREGRDGGANAVGEARDHDGAILRETVERGIGHVGRRHPHELRQRVRRLFLGESRDSANSVSTGPGHSTVMVTPVPLSSARVARLYDSTNAFAPPYPA